MIYKYTNKAEVLKTEQACGYILAKTINNDIVELHIHENGLIPSHVLPINVAFYVISGSGEVTVDGKTMEASKGDVIDVKRGLERFWQNPFREPLILLAIKQKS